jgi:hypothetical protein
MGVGFSKMQSVLSHAIQILALIHKYGEGRTLKSFAINA